MPRLRLPISRRRGMRGAAAVSLVFHLTLIALAVLWAHRPLGVTLPPDEPATVELVASPPGGTKPAQSAAPPAQTPPAPETQQAAIPPAPPADTGLRSGEVEMAPPSSSAPAAQNKLQFDFASVESDTNAVVTGDRILPATADVKFHNRKPSYPFDAAMRGEHGTVALLIHVGADGLVNGVDIVRSSGFAALDRAARDTALTWRFLPSVKNGQPVPDEVLQQIAFVAD